MVTHYCKVCRNHMWYTDSCGSNCTACFSRRTKEWCSTDCKTKSFHDILRKLPLEVLSRLTLRSQRLINGILSGFYSASVFLKKIWRVVQHKTKPATTVSKLILNALVIPYFRYPSALHQGVIPFTVGGLCNPSSSVFYRVLVLES